MIYRRDEMIDYDVTDYDLSVAMKWDEEIAKHRANASSQQIFTEHQNVASDLGEEYVLQYLQGVLKVPTTKPHPDRRKLTSGGDTYDILVAPASIPTWTRTIDVKTKVDKSGWNTTLERLLDFEVFLDEPEPGKGNQIQKPMDFYWFTLYQPTLRKVIILGWSTKQRYLSATSHRVVEKGGELYKGSNFLARNKCHLVKVRDLLAPEDFYIKAKNRQEANEVLVRLIL